MTIWSVDLTNPLVQLTVFAIYSGTRKILLLKFILLGSKIIKQFFRGG